MRPVQGAPFFDFSGERILRYMVRPALAASRLKLLPDGIGKVVIGRLFGYPVCLKKGNLTQGTEMNAPRMMFFELDGAGWNDMNPLLEKGELPNIQRLIDRGASGVLMSESPSFSPKIWTSIFSGKRHEKHGVTFFGANSKLVRTRRIWDILGSRDYRIGIFGSFVTWPPYPVEGFMIPSICALGTETFPARYEFFQKLVINERKKSRFSAGSIRTLWDWIDCSAKLLRHGTGWSTLIGGAAFLLGSRIRRWNQLDTYWRKALLHLKMSTRFLIPLMRRYQPDFCTWHIHTCDTIAHRYRLYHAPGEYEDDVDPALVARYGHAMSDSYRLADRSIGKVLELLDDDTIVIVASDHGSCALPKAIHPFSPRLDVIQDLFGLTDRVVVIRFGAGVYIHFREDDREFMALTEKRIRDAHFTETGDRFFFVKSFDNTLLVGKPNWKVDTERITDESTVSLSDLGTFQVREILTREETQVASAHADEGIVIAAGPNIRKGVRLPQSSIYDMTPTMLALLGLPVGKDMDGRVIEDAIEPDLLGRTRVKYIDTYEEGEDRTARGDAESIDHRKLEARLRELGYL